MAREREIRGTKQGHGNLVAHTNTDNDPYSLLYSTTMEPHAIIIIINTNLTLDPSAYNVTMIGLDWKHKRNDQRDM